MDTYCLGWGAGAGGGVQEGKGGADEACHSGCITYYIRSTCYSCAGGLWFGLWCISLPVRASSALTVVVVCMRVASCCLCQQ